MTTSDAGALLQNKCDLSHSVKCLATDVRNYVLSTPTVDLLRQQNLLRSIFKKMYISINKQLFFLNFLLAP